MSMHAADWDAVINELPAIATLVEQIVPAGTPSAQKAAAAVVGIAQVVPAVAPLIQSPDGAQKFQGYLAAAVALLNMYSTVFKKPTTQAATT